MANLMKQDSRFIGWSGDVAKEWVLLSLVGEEAISRPYRWLARFTTANGADPAPWLSKEVACRVGEDAEQRFVHGVVMQVEQQFDRDGKQYYQAVIEPQLVRTRQRSNLRVFQHTSVPDLVVSILKEHGIDKVKLSLSSDYAEQEYFIQYRESDFDFIHRLLESVGISYFFRHSASEHQLVLADHDKAWPASSVPALPFHPVSGVREHAGALSWTVNARVVTSQAEERNEQAYASVAGISVLDANGKQHADKLTQASKVRQQQGELQASAYQGEMSAFWLSAGESFELTEHPTASAAYGIRRMSLSASNNLESANHFHCSVECWPLAQPYRPECVTPVPTLAGIFNATVVGPDSEEIHTDEQGRIKIQFPWDDENTHDDSSSCWVRVSQPWAGSRFGAMFLPRIGSEVLVSFLQGHPDHPIVIGSVYNDSNPLPVALPDEKTQAGFVSRSSLEGEITEGHRLLFDDKKDSEKLIIASQKDLQLSVLNDAETTVGNDARLTIAANRSSEITKGNDVLLLKQGNSEITLEKGDLIHALKKGGYQISLENGDFDLTVSGNQTLKLTDGDQKTTISGGGSQLTADKACVIESTQSITLKVGGSEIAITPKGITLKGASLALQGQAEVKVEGAKVDIKGSAMLTLDGGLVNIAP